MELIKEVGDEELKFIFLKDDKNTLLEALYVKEFNEERYRKLRRYIREKLGEEFQRTISIGSNKALGKVLLISTDLVKQTIINDVVDMEAEKISKWLESGVIKELISKVSSEVKKTKKKKAKKKRSKSKKSKAKARRKSRRKSKEKRRKSSAS
nr:MAG: hypothetical protein TU36_08735 [Vulcanisaeta sp. AZ3]